VERSEPIGAETALNPVGIEWGFDFAKVDGYLPFVAGQSDSGDDVANGISRASSGSSK